MKQKSLFINCFPRLTPMLQQELESLGYTVARKEKMGVYVHGNYQDTYRMNYFLRTANKVLYEVERFRANDPRQFYDQAVAIEWEKLIPNKGYISISGFVRNDHIRDNRFAFMKLKDAIVDRLQNKTGTRPDSGPNSDRTVLYLRWFRDEVTISIDTSGETLAKHGYRKQPGKAPMMEPLAAAVLMASNWNRKGPLVNPMCGSGTLAIEAALMLRDIYPGRFRTNYGFMHTLLYDSINWQKVKREGDELIARNHGPYPRIIASDHDERVLQAARMNAREAGVEDMISFHHCDFRDTPLPSEGNGIIILNPEYGERLGQVNELTDVYKAIGDFFKQKGQGYTGYIFTGNLDLAKSVGLRTSRKIEFFNARIDSRLLEYELYSGTRK